MSEVLVLCYHAVSPTWHATLSVTPEALERQLGVLVRRGWRGATFTDAVLRAPSQRTLAVTFDDAFLSVLERAHPILARLGIPGTVFAPTAFLDGRRQLSWSGIEHWATTPHTHELQGMSWDDLLELRAHGWEVGSHTRSHPHLCHVDDDRLIAELDGSRQDIADGLGAPCSSVAYPYGDVDGRVAAQARRAGYACGASLSHHLTPLGSHRWPRVGIYHQDAYWRFWLKANGLTRRVRSSRLWTLREPAGGTAS